MSLRCTFFCFRNDDFAHETDYGYFYVNCDDMQKTPKEWDDQITQEASGHSRLGKIGSLVILGYHQFSIKSTAVGTH